MERSISDTEPMMGRLGLSLLSHSADIILHEEISLVGHLQRLGIVDQLADALQGRLLDLDGLQVEEEGHSEAEIAVGNVVVVECLLGGGQLDREFLVNRHRTVQGPVVERVGEVSGNSLEEIGEDQVALLSPVDHMHLDVVDLPIDDILADVVEVEAVGHEVFRLAVLGEVEGGEVEGGREVGVGEVVGDLRVGLIAEGDLDVERGVAGGQYLSFLGDHHM